MRVKRAIAAVAAVCVFVVPAVAQQAGRPQVVRDILSLLENEGWSADELSELATEAEAIDWTDVEGANAEAVALGLAFYRERDPRHLTPRDAAALAHRLAQTVVVMQGVGFRPVEIGKATVVGIRNAIPKPDSPGARVAGEATAAARERVISGIRQQMRVIASGRGSAAARGARGRAGPPSDVPGSGGGPTEAPPEVRVGPSL